MATKTTSKTCKVQAGCAHAFKEISEYMARADEKHKVIAEKLDKLSTAVVGNGKPEGSVFHTLAKLEQAFADHKEGGSQNYDRGWRTITALIAVVAILVSVYSILK